MFDKIKALFKTQPTFEPSSDFNELLSLNLELIQLEKKIVSLEKQLVENQKQRDFLVPIAGFDSLEIEPLDQKERLRYAGMVSEFHDTILKAKIRTSVAEVRELLSNVGFTEGVPMNMSRDQYDFFLRGIEAGLWKIHEWASGLQAELKQNKSDINNIE